MFGPLFPSFFPTIDDLDPSLPAEAVSPALRALHNKAVFGRMLQSTSYGTEAELAAWLGISQEEIAQVRQKRRIPDEWFFRLCFERRISVYWLLSGNGPERLPFVPPRDSREGRRLEHTLWFALRLCDEAMSARCAVAAMTRMFPSEGKEG